VIGDTSALTVPEKYMKETTPAMPEMTRDWALCRWIAKEHGIVGIPCSPFYSQENRELGKNYVRFAFCKTDETLQEAYDAFSKIPQGK
jgi:aspartate/methionine/tyrosine aminotransferase